ncbi:MAG: anti-sigma factor family protein [Actinomycetota bacterium]
MSHLDELLSVYLDGETTPAESRRVRVHLGECLRCRHRLQALQEARAAVRSLPVLEMPPELLPAPTTTEPPRRRTLWLGAAAAAAAALVVATAALNAPRSEPIDLSDLSRQIGARAALEAGSGTIKVVMPGVVTE